MNESIIEAAMQSADPLDAELAFKEIETELSSLTNPCERAALLLSKAALYGKLHRFIEAREEIVLALKAAPPDDPDITFQSESLDALFYHEERNLDEAFRRNTALLSKYAQHLQLTELRFIYEDIQQRRGFELVQLLRFEEAIPIFRECLSFKMQPEDSGEVLTYLGICYSRLKRYEEARDCFLDAFEVGLVNQTHGLVHFQLGIVYYHLGLFRKSKQELQLAEQHPNESKFPLKKLYRWLSSVCRVLGVTAEAEGYARLANPS
jgi:tetratricopeptide (TPR) repeat protein